MSEMSDTVISSKEQEAKSKPNLRRSNRWQVGTRRRGRNEDEWVRNSCKIKRNSGQGYVNRKNEVVMPKIFSAITECCKRLNCVDKLNVEEQEMVFDKFWDINEYNKQNYWLSNLLVKVDMKSRVITPVSNKNRTSSWQFFIDVSGSKRRVCKKFICELLQIGSCRLDVLQNKISNNESLEDKRGKKENKRKIADTAWNLLHDMLEKMPVRKKKKNERLSYFQDSELTMKKLYQMFLEYHFEKTQTHLKLSSSTFNKYFNTHCPYSFSSSKRDNTVKSNKDKTKSVSLPSLDVTTANDNVTQSLVQSVVNNNTPFPVAYNKASSSFPPNSNYDCYQISFPQTIVEQQLHYN